MSTFHEQCDTCCWWRHEGRPEQHQHPACTFDDCDGVVITARFKVFGMASQTGDWCTVGKLHAELDAEPFTVWPLAPAAVLGRVAA